jgi:hypothetical protein
MTKEIITPIMAIDYENMLLEHPVFPLENWNSFEVTHGGSRVDSIQYEIMIEKLQHSSSEKKPEGLYAYKKDGKLLYIGKGKPLLNRLKSHYRESLKQQKEPTRAKRWYDFFSKHSGQITIYWIEVEGESTRMILEILLHKYYKPAFNKIEPTK